MRLGSIVFSKAGRDREGCFAVVAVVDENYVRIADGEKHRLENAKLKKLKHLKDSGSVLVKIAEKLEQGAVVFNQEIRSALRAHQAGAAE
ncbi:MAG: RNA-binding protein [Clostridiaceae bacterium]|jgi:ribosomal protein L14E/L6E/L27E|nr:RNA-binding protein [Clostridiaceae bacterium]